MDEDSDTTGVYFIFFPWQKTIMSLSAHKNCLSRHAHTHRQHISRHTASTTVDSMDLSGLATLYGVDKIVLEGTGHNYIATYSALFADLTIPVHHLMEIGIGTGGHISFRKQACARYEEGNSLRMWRDYFTAATIHGVDIYQVTLCEEKNRILTYVADQSNEDQMRSITRSIGSTIDIIIDDGSHLRDHQVMTFMILWDRLTVGGLYIIEDIQYDHVDDFFTLRAFPDDFVKGVINVHFTVLTFDHRQEPGRPDDDVMIVFQRR